MKESRDLEDLVCFKDFETVIGLGVDLRIGDCLEDDYSSTYLQVTKCDDELTIQVGYQEAKNGKLSRDDCHMITVNDDEAKAVRDYLLSSYPVEPKIKELFV